MNKPELTSRHRDTVAEIFSHPTSHNIEWRHVISLLEHVGEVQDAHNGKLKVTLGPETEAFHRPHGKDVNIQMVVDLRRMLTNAGYSPDS
ncbi:MAG: hypothetical protein NTV40_00610 [Solirubrobacterales bacterium]|nr:hypothetical protein [Solirubrobacterales bacterium]